MSEQQAIVAANEVAAQYFQVLGGLPMNFDPETGRRMFDFAKELCSKRSYQRFTTFDSDSDEMIIGDRFRLFSFCEHHLLPFFGEVAIGYIPNGKIFGLSKFQRIIDALASKPQLQEPLTQHIRDFIIEGVKPKGVAVRIRAAHTCVFARGTQSTNAVFTTLSMWGNFKENAQTRNEFLQNISSEPLKL